MPRRRFSATEGLIRSRSGHGAVTDRMTYKLIDPPLPGLGHYRRLRRHGARNTMLRRMELDLIAGLPLRGCVLDFGGGEATGYRRLLPPGIALRSVNISTEFRPTDLVAPGDPLPFADGHFDAVLSFNVLEHIHDDVSALAELARVLRPGGALHVIVPWMYPVHGHPDDFNRHTPSWWGATLDRLGFSGVAVLPLVFGRRTSALMIRGRGDRAVRGLVEGLAAVLDVAEARLRFGSGDSYTGRRGETVWSSAPGWYVHAARSGATPPPGPQA